MDWEKLKNEGNAMLKDGDSEGAVVKYTKALELCKDDVPNTQILHSNRSAAYLKSGDMESALKDAEQCIEVGSEWPKGYSRKAAVLREMKRYEEAVKTAEEGLKFESSNVALKTIQKACETSLVCRKLRGKWHGTVAPEVGGYMQSFDFWSDSDVRVSVLGTTVDAKYELNVSGVPYPHLDMSVPSSPGSAFVRHIYCFENDDELHLCSPYLRPPEERPTEFSGAGMVVMHRGEYIPSEEERKEREEMLQKPLEERVVLFLKRCVEAVPKFDIRPREGESETKIGEKLTENVKFQTTYQGLITQFGPDAEQRVKDLVVGLRSLNSESSEILALVHEFQHKMRVAGLISDGDDQQQPVTDTATNAIVGVAPEEVLQSKEAMTRFVSGADEPLLEIAETTTVPKETTTKLKPKASKPTERSTAAAVPERDWTPVIVTAAVVTVAVAVVAAYFFEDRRRD